MLASSVLARIEQTDHLLGFRIDSNEVWAFMAVTAATRECEIAHDGFAPVLPRNDVIHDVSEFRELFREMTVLARALSTIPDRLFEGFVHRAHAAGLRNDDRAFVFRMTRKSFRLR